MKKHLLFFLLPLMALLTALVSCSESSDGDEEYADWQTTNDAYYDSLYKLAKAKADLGDNSWRVIKSWTLDSGYVAQHSYDYIVVHVLESGNTGVKPEYNDSVRVHYSGHLLPSKSYAQGYVFDKSYQGEFNAATAVPAQFKVSGLINGFTTALQHMELGDRWEVYIPYQLGYDTEANGAIPAYSTLVYDMSLVGIYRYGSAVPEWKAKANDMWP